MYVSSVLELESKQAAYQKTMGTPGKEEKAQQLQASVDKAQQAADAAREEHEKVTARLLEELQRYTALNRHLCAKPAAKIQM